MSKNLQMSLKTKWFEMTKSGEKTEDYREINEYWFKRLVYHWKEHFLSSKMSQPTQQNIEFILNGGCFGFNDFYSNIMTLGYPRKDDKERIIKFEHTGIEIREGREEWGAEPGKLYFVIKHGRRLVDKVG